MILKKDIVTKYISQYSEPLPDETMESLKAIAEGYCRVKDETYRRYSGIRNMGRLTPYYGILNEMRHCGLRQQIGLPSVYYEVAVIEAVGDIKANWGMLKNKLRERITQNPNLSPEERRYLRTVLKVDSIYAAVLNRQEHEVPKNSEGDALETGRLDNLLRRLTRKYLTVPETKNSRCFSVSHWGYLYEDGVIRLTSLIPRKRLTIPVKGGQTTERQIRIILEEHSVRISIPVDVPVRRQGNQMGTIYAHIGSRDMITLSNGHVYGQGLGELTASETERLYQKNLNRSRMRESFAQSADAEKRRLIEQNNLGKEKYDRIKRRERARTEDYINAELNRMLAEERPAEVVVTRPVLKGRWKSHSGELNRKRTRSFQGYVRERLRQKCEANGIKLTKISSKGTGFVCSACGEKGKRLPEGFACEACGFRAPAALNSARNIEKIYIRKTEYAEGAEAGSIEGH